jgi:hypothetical protein
MHSLRYQPVLQQGSDLKQLDGRFDRSFLLNI